MPGGTPGLGEAPSGRRPYLHDAAALVEAGGEGDGVVSRVQRGMLARRRPQRQVSRVDQAASTEEVPVHYHHQLSLLALHRHWLLAGDGSRLGVFHPGPGVGFCPCPPARRVAPGEMPGWVGSHLARCPAEKSEDQAAFGSHPSFFQQTPAQRAGAAPPAFISPRQQEPSAPGLPFGDQWHPKASPRGCGERGGTTESFPGCQDPPFPGCPRQKKHPRQPLWGRCL